MKYRTIGVNLDRNYRNDLNANFEQIGNEIHSLDGLTADMKTQFLTELGRIERESKERDDLLTGESLDALLSSIKNAITNANQTTLDTTEKGNIAEKKGIEAEQKGNEAQEKGNIAKKAADTANLKAEYADEKAVAANEAADRANSEASNLDQLKIGVVEATQNANRNEETRKSNETKRLQSESSRFVAELERQDNEDERIANETQRQKTFTSKINDVTEKTNYAKQQGDYAKQVADQNKTRWLAPVQDYNAILSTYPNPQYGDQVSLISDGKEYRYTTEWEVMRIPSSSAIAELQRQLQEMKDELSVVDGGTFGTAPSSYALDGGTF